MSFRKRNVVLSGGTPSGDSSPQQPPQPGAAPAVNRNAAGLAQMRGVTGGAASLRTPLGGSAASARLPVRPSPGAARANAPSQPSVPRVQLPPVTWKTASIPPISDEELARLEPEMRILEAQLEAERKQRQQPKPVVPLDPGARPSPFDGRPITSTGTASVDQLLAGYGGLVLGHSILIQELGTTDFSSVLLRAYAAEGLVQGHHVHVLGFGPGWRTELPGILSPSSGSSRSAKAKEAADNDKMKIAWRYEALSARPTANTTNTKPGAAPSSAATFCHAFDLTKRLAPTDIKGTLHAFPLPNPLKPSPQPEHVHSPLRKFLASIKKSLDSTPPSSIHRVVLPNFLAPTLYAMDGWTFPYVIALFAGLRAMLRDYSRRLTVMVSMSTSLYSHDNECVFRLETLCDNIVELIPLPPGPPSAMTASNKPTKASFGTDKGSPADKMQGWFKVHKLQVYSELGGGGTGAQGKPLTENLCFSVSGHKGLVVTPYSLPPIEEMGPKEKTESKKDDIEF